MRKNPFQAPVFTLSEHDKTIKTFESYATLYKWCQKNDKKTLGFILGNADVTLLFGQAPMKYDRGTNELYLLGWTRIDKLRIKPE